MEDSSVIVWKSDIDCAVFIKHVATNNLLFDKMAKLQWYTDDRLCPARDAVTVFFSFTCFL